MVDGNNDIWVVKLKPDYKTIEWQRVIGGSQYDNAQSILQTPDGNYMIAGYSYSPDFDVNGHHACDAVSPTCRDGWVLKLRGTDGAIMWSKCYGGSGDENFYGIQPTNDGGYLLAGYTASNDGDVTGFHDGTNNNNDGFGDGWLVKIDSSGKLLWQKTVGGTLKDIFTCLNKAQDGGFVVGGFTNSSDFDLLNIKSSYTREAWVVRLDTSGKNILWQNVLGYTNVSGFDSRVYGVKQTKKGEYVIGGTTAQIPYKQDGMGNIDMDVFIAKLSATGTLKWKKSFGGSDDDWGSNVISLDADDGVLVSGYTFSSDGDVSNYHGLRDAWVVRCDSLGNKTASSTVGGGDFDYIYASTTDNFGKYILAGATKSHDSFVPSNPHGDTDAWFFEMDINGTCSNVGTICNDNDPHTINDVVQSDCTCRGTTTVLTISNCPQPITVNAAQGATTIVVSWTAPTPTTTCTNGLTKLTQTAGLTNGAAFPIGAQNVTYTATDSCANTKTCTFIVTVNTTTSTYNCPTIQKNFGDVCNDNNANTINDVIQNDCTCKGTPTTLTVLTCPTPITVTAAAGATTTNVSWVTPTASTTCTNGLLKITQTFGGASGTLFPVSTTPTSISYAIKDSCANTAPCTFTITVKSAGTFDCPTLSKNIGDACDDGNANTINDKIQSDCTCKGTPKQGALTINCSPNITVNATGSATTAVATWTDPTTSTTCPITGSGGTGTCTASSFAGFTSLGKFGNSQYYFSMASSQWDNANIICKSNGGHLVTINTQAENDFVLSKIGAGNAVYIGLSDKNGIETYTWADGSSNAYTNWEGGTPNNNGASLGNYTAMLSWSAGRWSNQNKYVAKQFVMEIECGGNGIALTQTAGGAKGSALPIGTQTVTYQAADSCGNVQTCSFTVTVNKIYDCVTLQKNIGDTCDDGNPNTTGDKIQTDCTCKGTTIPSTLTLTCPTAQTITVATGQTSAVATWITPTPTTTCIGNAIKLTQTAGQASGSTFPIGTQAISYTVVDSCGSTKACSFTITVNGGVSTSTLTVSCPQSVIVTAVSGATTAIATWSTPTATTTCAGGFIKIGQTDSTFKSGSGFPVGTINTITVIANDNCNSVKSCSFTVTANASSTVGPDLSLRFQNTQTSFVRFSNFHYLLEVKNVGNSPMTNVAIQFKFPAGTVNGGTTVPSIGTWQTYCAGGVQCYQWSIPNLPLNSVATLDAVVFVLNVISPIVATAQILSATPIDSNPVNDVATLTLAPPLNLTAANTSQAIPIVIEKIYPNPVVEELDLNLSSLVDQDIDFKFFNSLGSIINLEKRHVEKGANIFRFDVSSWETGVYYVLPNTREGINVPIKFIKLE